MMNKEIDIWIENELNRTGIKATESQLNALIQNWNNHNMSRELNQYPSGRIVLSFTIGNHGYNYWIGKRGKVEKEMI
jgi:hypothetical protein